MELNRNLWTLIAVESMASGGGNDERLTSAKFDLFYFSLNGWERGIFLNFIFVKFWSRGLKLELGRRRMRGNVSAFLRVWAAMKRKGVCA